MSRVSILLRFGQDADRLVNALQLHMCNSSGMLLQSFANLTCAIPVADRQQAVPVHCNWSGLAARCTINGNKASILEISIYMWSLLMMDMQGLQAFDDCKTSLLPAE